MIGARWSFPLIVIAVSSREVGFVAAMRPMQLDGACLWYARDVSADARPAFLERRVIQAVQKFDPATIVVTHGSRWRLSQRIRRRCQRVARKLGLHPKFVDLEDACSSLGCARTLRALALRIADVHPELEHGLRSFVAEEAREAAVRELRPVLSALAVAHAALVTHLMKFG